MHFFVGVTDYDWYQLHSYRSKVGEVCLWSPSPDASFRALQTGEPFLFKLHSPRNFIAGGPDRYLDHRRDQRSWDAMSRDVCDEKAHSVVIDRNEIRGH